jgi:hypothetical protein
MLRSTLLIACIAGPLLFSLAPAANSQGSITPGGPVIQPQPNCVNSIVREPVVMFDVSGSTLLGPQALHMTVYNDGFVTISKKTTFPSAIGVESAQIPLLWVHGLVNRLDHAGALQLCDQDFTVSDIPLTSVSLIGGNGQSHSFNYWIGTAQYQRTEQVMRGFINHIFPGF